jgi:hypothetical protein
MSKRLLIDEDTLTIVLYALDFAGKVLAECKEDVERYECLTDRLASEMNEAPYMEEDGRLIKTIDLSCGSFKVEIGRDFGK